MAGPIGANVDGSGDFHRGLQRWPGLDPQEQDTAVGGQHGRGGQLAEILVECQADTTLANGHRQHLDIGNARRRFPNPHRVVATPAKLLDEMARDILIAQPPHRHAALG